MFNHIDILLIVSLTLLLRPIFVLSKDDGDIEERKSKIHRSLELAYLNKDLYKKIDKYLVDNVASDEVEANLKKAVEWLNLLSSKKKSSFSSKQPLIEILERFTSLSVVLNSKRCDYIGYGVIASNDKALKGLEDLKKESHTRVASIVYKCAMKHSIDCQYVYPKVYNDIYPKMDKRLVHRVETFTDMVIQQELDNSLEYFYDENLRLFDMFIKESYKSTWHNRLDLAKTAHDAINVLAEAEYDWKFLKTNRQDLEVSKSFRAERVGTLFRKYLVESCQYYTERLGHDVFIPARHDAMITHIEKNLDAAYYRAWARFRICDTMINPIEEQSKLLKKVVLLSSSAM